MADYDIDESEEELPFKQENETEQRFANQNLGNALQENKQIKRNLEQENAINPSAECSASGMAAVSATTACLNQEQVCSRQVIPRELPVFNGKPEEWPLFISSYENSSKLCGFTNDENLLRLQRALRSKALAFVSSKLTLPALVSEVITTLRMLFGRPESILQNLLLKL